VSSCVLATKAQGSACVVLQQLCVQPSVIGASDCFSACGHAEGHTVTPTCHASCWHGHARGQQLFALQPLSAMARTLSSAGWFGACLKRCCRLDFRILHLGLFLDISERSATAQNSCSLAIASHNHVSNTMSNTRPKACVAWHNGYGNPVTRSTPVAITNLLQLCAQTAAAHLLLTHCRLAH
jgi:hypothetical protein